MNPKSIVTVNYIGGFYLLWLDYNPIKAIAKNQYLKAKNS